MWYMERQRAAPRIEALPIIQRICGLGIDSAWTKCGEFFIEKTVHTNRTQVETSVFCGEADYEGMDGRASPHLEHLREPLCPVGRHSEETGPSNLLSVKD